MKPVNIILRILLFIVLTTFNTEYLINEQSSTLLSLLALFIELLLIYFLIIPIIKTILKK